MDIHLHRQEIEIERKHLTLDLRQNPRGRFLRITEEVGGRFDFVVVPVTGIEQLRAALEEIIRFNESLPPPV